MESNWKIDVAWYDVLLGVFIAVFLSVPAASWWIWVFYYLFVAIPKP